MALNYNSSQIFVFCWFLATICHGGTMAVEDMISGQSTDISERIERLEMQMNKLQVDLTSMENILGEILLALSIEPDDQLQMQNYYEVKRSTGSTPNNMPFLGSRGKKMVFLGSRGKRPFTKRLAFLGSRGRRAGGPPSFYGSRG